MKKKILLMLTMVLMLVFVLAIAVSAESVHSGKVDLNATVTLDNGTVLNLFDANGNALIWYIDASSDTGYSSVRADSGAGEADYTGGTVVINQSYQFNVGNSTVGTKTAYECNSLTITVGGSSVNKGNIVVFNVMDDDVLTSNGNPFNCFKDIFWSNSNLQYAYLRLDTVALQANALNACENLKYVNLEDLTELRQLSGSTFNRCTSLLSGQVLDLTGTKLVSIGGNAVFAYLPIVGLKLPKTVTSIGDWSIQGSAITTFTFPTGVATIGGSQFNDCKSLKEIYINNTTTSISDRAFNNTVLEKIFFVGTEAELNTLLDNTGANNNAPFWDVVGTDRANIISYAEYEALEDKSGKYAVYDYNYCEAYTEGVHTPSDDKISACVSSCTDCGIDLVEHVDGNVTTTIVYASFLSNGEKVTACQNAKCTHNITESTEALFICQGYSGPLTGNGGVLIGFAINKNAIGAYTDATDKTLSYGLFAGTLAKLGTNEAVSTDGVAQNGAVSVDFTNRGYDIMEIKVVGFETDEHKSAQVILGAYVIETNGDKKTVSYLQSGEIAEGKKYVSKSYNDLLEQAQAEEQA